MSWRPLPAPSSASVRAAAIAALGAAAAGALAMLYRLNPATTDIYPRCPFFVLTGWYCPGCGSLRAMHQLVHGDVAAAASYNVLLVASIPVIAGLLAVPRWRQSPAVARAALWLIVCFGVGRNIPAWPFTLLHP
jgi:hypothetical protein